MRKARVSPITAFGITAASLYFAQEVLIPLALSVMLAFLIAPFATRLERLRFGRIASVLVPVGLASVVILTLGWVVGRQVVSLAEQLPQYRDEIIRKAASLRGTGSGLGSKIEQLGTEIEKAVVQPTTRMSPPTSAAKEAQGQSAIPRVPGGDPGAAANASDQIANDPIGVAARAAVGGAPPTSSSPVGTTPANPFFAVALPAPVSPIKTLGTYLGLVLGPLGTGSLVLVFVIFMLLERKDLRDRLIRLISREKYTLTTRALDDAASRISRYILAQSIVNGSYGFIVAIGLWTIGATMGHGTGFPSFILWGLLCAVLRFVPYVGPGLASIFPATIALAVYPGFGVFIAVVSLILVNELISNNIVEPWLYGASTGLSTVAIMVAAVFWTWLWGPIGLLLATPLTVCIVVLGKYVPQLKFLDVLLGDQPALPPAASFYQRLVAGDRAEASIVARELSIASGPALIADELLIPALRLTRRDREDGDLSADAESGVLDAMGDIIEEARIKLEASRGVTDGTVSGNPAPLVIGCAAHHRAEELTLQSLSQPNDEKRYRVDILSTRLLPAEIETRVRLENPAIVFIAVVPPGGILQARYLCRRLRKEFPELHIIVGYWGRVRHFDRFLVRFRKAGASYVTTTMQQSRNQIIALLTGATKAPNQTTLKPA